MTSNPHSEQRNASTIDFSGTIRDVGVDKTTATIDTNRKTNEGDIESDGTMAGSFSSPTQEGPSLTIVNDLSVYEGQTLEEKVDSFINSHAVIMFHKTWCLFSLDAQSFLVEQMKVSLHAIEVDIHPQGAAILKYIQEKNNHRTVPVIYIKGTFLGGFDDVNQLYATGQLQELYLMDLTQADRCEEFMTKANVGKKPLFWFPATVNAHVVRLSGVMSCLCAAFSAVSVHWVEWGRYVGYALFFDYVLRLLAGSRLSILGQLATLMASPLTPKSRHGRPKQFATMCGIMFSGLGALFYVLHFLPYHDYIGTAFMGGLAVASGMEGFLDFCLGCVFFKYGIKLGLIPK
jgi:glutaredoxin